MKQINFTQEGLKSLKIELQSLEEQRPEAVKELSRARELGDLSENGLYHAAKARLRSIDSKMNKISRQIKLSRVVTAKKYLVEQNGKQVEYQIVGDFEADPGIKKISINSPLGHALFNKKAGDETTFVTPNGKQKMKVIKLL